MSPKLIGWLAFMAVVYALGAEYMAYDYSRDMVHGVECVPEVGI